VFQTGTGQWRGVISLGYDAEGKRVQRTVYGGTKVEALDKLRRLQADADAGRLTDADGLTVVDYLRRWLDTTAKAKTQDGTHERYEQLFAHLRWPLGTVRLAKFQPVHVEQVYHKMATAGASAWTRRMAGTMLSNALRHAVRLKLIPHNPAADVAKARPAEKEMKYLTQSQALLLLDAAAGHRLFALFAVALGSGLRQGELLGLRWGDVDLDAGTVTVRRTLTRRKGKKDAEGGSAAGEFVLKEPKSRHSRRTVALPGFALDALREHRSAMLREGNIAAPVFCTRTGNFLGKSNFTRQTFKPMLTKANARAANLAEKSGAVPEAVPTDLRFHDLRHTHASHLIAAGESVKAVSRRLGHASIEVTLRVYAHLMPNDDAKLAARVEGLFGRAATV
jgi:integrase